MKRKRWRNLAGLVLLCLLAGCGAPDQPETAAMASATATATASAAKEDSAGDMQDWQPRTSVGDVLIENQKEALFEDFYGDYQEEGGEIAFLTDGILEDEAFNEAIYDGIQLYAMGAGVSFSHYGVGARDPQGYRDAVALAAEKDAKIIVCAGWQFGEAVGSLQEVYPDVSFLMVDGTPVDETGALKDMNPNVHSICFHEEQSGYLAGYLTVLEGYRRLGFIGGKEDPSVVRYGYGYLQGIEAAVQEHGIEDVSVRYWYAGSYEPSREIQETAADWYAAGTEVIFSCGGSLYESVLEAAEETDGLLIGVDVDQSRLSKRVLTSAMKDISHAVVISLDDYYATGAQWSDAFAGKQTRYGIEENCAELPIQDGAWRFANVTKQDYYDVYQRLKKGEAVVSDETGRMPEVSYQVEQKPAEK